MSFFGLFGDPSQANSSQSSYAPGTNFLGTLGATLRDVGANLAGRPEDANALMQYQQYARQQNAQRALQTFQPSGDVQSDAASLIRAGVPVDQALQYVSATRALKLQQNQDQAYQSAVGQLTAPAAPNPVTVTPKVTDINGQINRAPPSAYQQPAMSEPGPLAGNSIMTTALRGMSSDQGLPELMSLVGPHKLDYQQDGQGVIHAFDSVTGREVGTYGNAKPVVVNPGQTVLQQSNSSSGGGQGVGAQNLTNNNPGNLRVPGKRDFQTFPDMQTGINAVGSQIQTYVNRGTNTIAGIVSTYAPTSDGNDVAGYTNAVSRLTGIAPNAPVQAADIPKIRDAMITVEQGGKTPQQLLAQPQGNGGYSVAYQGASLTPRPMNEAELQKYHANPGSTIVDATGKIDKATAQNSAPTYSPDQLKAMAYEMVQNGGKPLQGRDQMTNRLINDTMTKPVSQGGIRPDNIGPQEWASLVTNAGISRAGKQQAANLLAKQQALTAVNEGTVNNSIGILTKLIPSAASHGRFTSLNELGQWFGRQTNDPNAANFKNAIDSISAEYARVMTGSTTGAPSSDSARAEAAQRILLGYNSNTLPSVLAQMQAEMRGRSQAQIAGLQAITGGQFSGIPVSGSQPQSNSAAPSGPKVIRYDINGKRIP